MWHGTLCAFSEGFPRLSIVRGEFSAALTCRGELLGNADAIRAVAHRCPLSSPAHTAGASHIASAADVRRCGRW